MADTLPSDYTGAAAKAGQVTHTDNSAKWARRAVARFTKGAGGVHPRDCPLCGYRGLFPAFRQPPRLDAKCGSCGSLERHRLFMLCCEATNHFQPDHKVLHFAPEAHQTRYITPRVGIYETADLRVKPGITHGIDIQATCLPADSYDRIVCNHVLEHVDDARTLSEFFRILKPGGKAIVTTPIVEGWAQTCENPEVRSGQDRYLHFGPSNHVGYFGRDLRDRIRAQGFELDEFTAVEPLELQYGLMRGETIFIATGPQA